jgi:hypothetical protein
MVARDEAVQVKIRMRESMRRVLADAAARRGATLTAEVVRRLAQTIQKEAPGGPAVAPIIRLAEAAFLEGGARAARDSGHPEWDATTWVSDWHCYRTAMWAMVSAMLAAMPANNIVNPNATLEERQLFERLYDVFAVRALQGQGDFKVQRRRADDAGDELEEVY